MNKYFNRELSWLEFNRRVLEIFDRNNLLLGEKLKFISIFYDNLDEFYMVRVGSLWDQSKSEQLRTDKTGLNPDEELNLISTNVREMYEECYSRYNDLKKLLSNQGINIVDISTLSLEEIESSQEYFTNKIFPYLTFRTMQINAHFPLIKNKTINILVSLLKDNEEYLGEIQIPENLKRIVPVGDKNERKFILLEQLISSNLNFLFDSYQILEKNIFRIIRNADLNYDDDDDEDLLTKVERSIKKRNWGQIVRLEIVTQPSKKLLKVLKDKMKITDREILVINNDLDLTYLDQLYKKKWFVKFQHDEFIQKNIFEKRSIIAQIREKDHVCHFPYDNFQCILDFLEEASNDAKVIAIKQTLYRVSKDSPIVEALINAAKKGKNVTVLLEVKARFDEANNIAWAKRLEKAGVQVILSPLKLKTHAKLLLIVRKEKDEKDGIKTYCHLGTGNFNENTAVTYEDIGVFTADKMIGEDVIQIFNFLASGKEINNSRELIISPFNSRQIFHNLVDYEINEVKLGKKGLIRAKMNSLIDQEMMDKLYEASKAGVKIKLIVRGICGIIPNKNISVKSIVGRFLEHSRIYYFYQGGQETTLIGSMDLMDRNFDRRVETLCPIKDSNVKKEIIDILDILDSDSVNSYILNQDGKYKKVLNNDPFDAHKYFMNGEK